MFSNKKLEPLSHFDDLDNARRQAGFEKRNRAWKKNAAVASVFLGLTACSIYGSFNQASQTVPEGHIQSLRSDKQEELAMQNLKHGGLSVLFGLGGAACFVGSGIYGARSMRNYDRMRDHMDGNILYMG